MRTLLQTCAGILLSLRLAACASQQKLAPENSAAEINPASRPTTIALLGGTGMVGGHILQRALARGYPLRVLSRSPEKLSYLAGDAREPDVINTLLTGADVVISAIGPGAGGPADLTTTVSENIVSAMGKQGISRYLVVSGAGVETPDERRNFTGWLIRQLARLRYPTLLRDRQNEYARLVATELEWTIARCPLIDSGNARQPAQASLQTPDSFRLTAGALAEFLLDQIADPRYVQRAPFVYNGAR